MIPNSCIKTGVVDMKTFTLDSSPEYMRAKAKICNEILDGKKTLDIFGCARVGLPIEATVGALGELVKEGKIGGI
jgi:pyridoxine 4-dehydrogenase